MRISELRNATVLLPFYHLSQWCKTTTIHIGPIIITILTISDNSELTGFRWAVLAHSVLSRVCNQTGAKDAITSRAVWLTCLEGDVTLDLHWGGSWTLTRSLLDVVCTSSKHDDYIPRASISRKMSLGGSWLLGTGIGGHTVSFLLHPVH